MNKKHYTLIISFLMLVSAPSFALGSKKPSVKPSNPSTPVAPVTPPEEVTTPEVPSDVNTDFGSELTESEYLHSSILVGEKVDALQNDNELSGLQRDLVNEDRVDKCLDENTTHEYFADQIAYYTNVMLEEVPAKVGFIGSYYGTSSNDNNYYELSLIKNPLCPVTAATLGKTVNKVPGAATITKLNNFTNKVNALRKEVLSGSHAAKKELHVEWTRLFSCLAYTESLSTADATSSKSVASSNAPTGYRKPAGVKFYNDPAQDAASRLNIGMFQFTPNSSGNIQPCIRAWNALHTNKTSCQISQSANKSELIKSLGSSLQSFNAFCGIHKVIQTFAIQANTTKTTATHPSNLVGGKLVASSKRCVSPHFQAGKAYNHFGPFQNSTGANLEKLFSCIEKAR